MTTLTSELISGDGQPVTVSEIVDTYRNLVNISIPSSGKIQKFNDNTYSITCKFKTEDCDKLESVETLKVYSLSTQEIKGVGKSIKDVRCISDPHEVVELASATSENGRFLARLKKTSTKDDTERQLLQIWDRSKLLKTIDVSESEVHGSVLIDPVFGSICWSKYGEQDKLLYVCKAKQPKETSYFTDTSKKIDVPTVNDDSIRGKEYLRKQDWGECLAGIEHTVVSVLDVSNDCKVIAFELSGFSLADSQWLGKRIVSVAYQEEPRRLGIIYCNNRVSKIVVHDWMSQNQNPVLELEEKGQCFHHPRVNHSADKFLYLSNPTFGTHFQSVKLSMYSFDERVVSAIVDSNSTNEGFFIDSLPKNCFTLDDKCIFFTINSQTDQHLCRFDLDKGLTIKLKFPTSTLSILDFEFDMILASGSEANATPTLFVATLESSHSAAIAWHQIEDCVYLDYIDYNSWQISTLDKLQYINGILMTPNIHSLHSSLPEVARTSLLKDPSLLPTIVQVHGGPHANFTTSYSYLNALYIRLGMNVLQINYRGSTGISQDYSGSLLGNIGKLDVEDCMHAIRHFVVEGSIDPSKLIIFGGSHGGFLSCHLSCQEEFLFKSAIIRNPVVDLTTLHSTADIPDWVYAEALGHKSYNPSWNISHKDLIELYDCSPMFHCSKANVPTLMSLGNKDLRVPMFQGERWIDRLKARGIDTLCKVYNDNHSLSKVHVRSDFAITSVIWILTHL